MREHPESLNYQVHNRKVVNGREWNSKMVIMLRIGQSAEFEYLQTLRQVHGILSETERVSVINNGLVNQMA